LRPAGGIEPLDEMPQVKSINPQFSFFSKPVQGWAENHDRF
jgi:hypothetical protein